jgi:hypothetical protein
MEVSMSPEETREEQVGELEDLASKAKESGDVALAEIFYEQCLRVLDNE